MSAAPYSQSERVLPFTGIHNFRDYGDYPVAGGARVAARRLYRSAQHRDASPDDLVKVGALALSTVIDLRGARERDAAPCPRPVGFDARVIFSDQETAGLAPHLQAARDADGPEGVRAAMCRGYAAMPFRPFLVSVMRDYFAVMEGDGPTLIHCAAGKDRTGLAVALLHMLLGVHRDDLMADYLLTNVAGRVEARIEAGASVIRSQYGATLSDAAIRALMMVEPIYLEAAFAAIVERHGSVEAYLRDELAVDGERRDKIRATLLI